MKVSQKIRKQFGESDDRRDAGVAAPEGLTCLYDIAYGSDDMQKLDLYRLEGTEDQKMPVLVSVHGGGWVYGDKERYRLYCQSLAKRGFVVVNFSYRLAPEHPFPASLEDTCMAFDFVMTHSEEYHYDLDYMFAVGDSAGGHLLGLYLNLLTNSAFASFFDFKPVHHPDLKAIALNCGVYHIDLESDELSAALMKEVLPNGGDEKELKMVNVLDYTNKLWPPVFLMSASGDFLRQDAYLMAQKLVDLQKPFEFHFYDDGTAKLGHVFNLNLKRDISTKCNDEECQFFASFLKKF